MRILVFLGLVACSGDADTNSADTDHDDTDPLETDDPGDVCDPVDGLPALTPCTNDDPCQDRDGNVITSPTDVPLCRTTRFDHPVHNDGPARTRVDADGHERHACVFVPEDASATSRRPLVVFLHGGSGTADDAYNATLLREKAESWELSDDPARPGFVFVSIQARNVHYPYGALNDGRHHDTLHWDAGTNPDVANLDAWIDTVVATGVVDTERIHVLGWSEGQMTSVFYGMLRHDVPTPGGHRIASIAGYTGSSPFDRAALDGERCRRTPLPESSVPFIGMSRACDATPCDAAQQEALVASGGTLGDVIPVDAYRRQLTGDVGLPMVWHLLGDSGEIVPTCDPTCDAWRARRNHLVWPDGTRDEDGIDQEPAMLAFLRDHPL